MRKLSMGLLALLSLVGVAHADDVNLTGVGARWAADWSARNLGAAMTLYAPEPVFQPTSGKEWVGSGAIRRHFAEVLAQFTANLHLHSERSRGAGDLGYDSGTYDEDITPIKGGKATHYRGNYLFLLQRSPSGAWNILEQTWTEYDPSKL